MESYSSENNHSMEWKDFSSYKKAAYLMNNKPDCSFVVGRPNCEKKTLNFHTRILRNSSPVFETMFNGHFKESNLSNEIHISDTDPITFKKFMDFIYYGNTENFQLIDILTVRNLIYLGKKYMVEGLTESCIENMTKNLEIAENYDLIYTFEYAYLMEDSELIDKCKKVITGRIAKSDFRPPLDFNINRQEEKRHIAQARRSVTGFQGNLLLSHQVGSSTTNPNFSFPTTTTTKVTPNFFTSSNNEPTTKKTTFEEKIENTDNIFSQSDDTNVFGGKYFGVNKGNITSCSYIYDLNPPIFNEFQKTLSGHICEVTRFKMIETYAKINGFVGETIDHIEKTLDSNGNNQNNNNNIININNEAAEINKTSDNVPAAIKNQSPLTVPLQKEMLNMMLCSINFLRMSAKEFCIGPGKSSLLDTEEKYNILVGIVNKN